MAFVKEGLVSDTHSAPGQLAGYLFQPERALYHLATSGLGAFVGIETLDDVAVRSSDGSVTREQDKHYISDATPLADRSKELWNTLYIWLKAVDEGEIDLATTELQLVTNRKLTSGIARALHENGSTGPSPDILAALIKRLRAAGKRPPKKLREQVKLVLAHSDAELMALLSKVRVIDGSDACYGAELRSKVALTLHAPGECMDAVLDGLLGWIHDTVLMLIRSGQPAWLSREEFSERYRRELFAHSDSRFFRETTAADIPVTDTERASLRENLFVKQLRWIGIEENDEQLIEAIDSVYRAKTETVRLTKAGLVAPSDFSAFDARLVEKWKSVRRLHGGDSEEEIKRREIGKGVLNRCMDHRETLAGQVTHEWYLTQGAFHKLADATEGKVPELGWHPRYRDQCIALKEKPKA